MSTRMLPDVLAMREAQEAARAILHALTLLCRSHGYTNDHDRNSEWLGPFVHEIDNQIRRIDPTMSSLALAV